MSTVLELIQAGYRRAGITSQQSTLDSAKSAVGLERVQSFYRAMAAGGLFGRQEEVYLKDNTAYEADEFQRVTNPFGATVTLPDTVVDLTTNDERVPMDGAIITVVTPGSEPAIHVRDNDRGEWVNIVGLTLNSHAPLTGTWDDALKNLFAVFLADDTGYPVSPPLAKMAGLGRLAMASRYGGPGRITPIEYF